jgi:two-component system, sporulation sensor kinase E
LKNDLEKVRTHVSFLMSDANRPNAVLELDGTIIEKNDAFCTSFAIEKIRNIKDFMDESTIDLWESFSKRANATEHTLFDMLHIQIPLKKTYFVKMHLTYFVELRTVVALFDSPKSYGRASEMTYLNAFLKSGNFEVIVDQNGIICDVNEMHTEFFNKSRDYFIGKSYDLLIHLFSDYNENSFTYIDTLKTHGYAETVKSFERSPGDVRHYHITTFHDKETDMYVVRMMDYTDKVRLEKQLDHSGSLSAVGQIAASIAHEIRNPMTTLKGFVQLLKISATTDTMKYLTVIDEEIIRMESILTEMLVLSKPASNKKTTFSLELIVADMVQVFHPKALMDGITVVQKEFKHENSLVFGDPDKIKQMLLNLFKNAFEAMSPGQELTIDIKLDNSGQLVLEISDTGKGMDIQQVNQLFIPFFTTKSDGTGLGLPFVLKTIEEHGGTISVESEIGKGTTFMVTFPSVISHCPGTILNEKGVLLTQ